MAQYNLIITVTWIANWIFFSWCKIFLKKHYRSNIFEGPVARMLKWCISSIQATKYLISFDYHFVRICPDFHIKLISLLKSEIDKESSLYLFLLKYTFYYDFITICTAKTTQKYIIYICHVSTPTHFVSKKFTCTGLSPHTQTNIYINCKHLWLGREVCSVWKPQ